MAENTPTQEPTTLKEKLKKMRMPVDKINQFLAYVQGEKTKEAAAIDKAKREGKNRPYTPVTSNTDDQLYTMAFKFWGLGLVIDGINVVITGRGMALPTFHGYKNKVKQIYPDATFDVQLVREGDTTSFAKESGSIVYSHQLGSPFEEKKIQGAYCVISFGGQQYLETLNERDYTAMKAASKNPSTWDKWPSEFWLKSVIKRACKRHFNDITIELDKYDNELYGINEQVKAPADKKASIIAAAKAGNADNA
jgi:hypothetical protein